MNHEIEILKPMLKNMWRKNIVCNYQMLVAAWECKNSQLCYLCSIITILYIWLSLFYSQFQVFTFCRLFYLYKLEEILKRHVIDISFFYEWVLHDRYACIYVRSIDLRFVNESFLSYIHCWNFLTVSVIVEICYFKFKF